MLTPREKRLLMAGYDPTQPYKTAQYPRLKARPYRLRGRRKPKPLASV